MTDGQVDQSTDITDDGVNDDSDIRCGRHGAADGNRPGNTGSACSPGSGTVDNDSPSGNDERPPF
jgi:hypothetical protein